jgi:DNA-binding beta-propeller fold protein YncE
MQVAGSSGYVPRGITIATSTDTLVFTGVTTGGIGVFSLPAAGGAVTPIAAGSPFVDPSGVATDPAGNIYVADTTAGGSHRADVFKITAGVVSVLAPDIYVGYPAGVAFSSSTQAVVVSGLLSVGGPDTLSSISPSGVITPFLSTGLSTLEAAAGLHRASIANAFAFVDSAGDGTDAVYVIK